MPPTSAIFTSFSEFADRSNKPIKTKYDDQNVVEVHKRYSMIVCVLLFYEPELQSKTDVLCCYEPERQTKILNAARPRCCKPLAAG
jgi:hypothetical protein